MKVRGPFQLPNRPTWYVDIGRKRKSLGTADEAEAKRMVKDITRRVLAGELDKLSGRTPTTPLHKFLSEYDAWSETVHRPATLRAERLACSKLLALTPRDTPVSSLTPKHFDTLAASLLKDKLKPSSVNLHLRHLKAIFQKAVAWKLCEDNPAKIKPLRTERKAPAFLPPEAVPKVLASIKDQEVRAMVTAYLATGRRRSELMALEWSDIEVGRYYVRKSKTHLSGWYPINSAFRAVLDARAGLRKPFGRWAHPDTVSKVVKKALIAAGHGELRLHDLRHSFSALYLMNGGSIFTLKELLGHQQVSTTQVYSHVTQGHLAEEVERVHLVTSDEQGL